jgi:hypothetical protein
MPAVLHEKQEWRPVLEERDAQGVATRESDATTQQEKEECLQAFRESADYMLSKHHKAFLGALQQMMVAVFGPGMEQAFSKAPIQGGTMELGESLLLRALEVKLSSLLRRVLGVSQFSPHFRPQEGSQSSHHRRAAQVNLCNSRIRTNPRTEI